jgi:GDSL-like Lipase/Acylhydrolase
LHNYAVSGAVCSNSLTPRTFLPQINFLFPSVLEYEVPAFLADKAFLGPSTNITGPLGIDDDKTVYAIWIGTNDLGNDAFLTDSQVKGKQITDYINCVYASLEKIYAAGGRWFVLMNVIPLNLAPQYALPSNGGVPADKYFKNKAEKNLTEISYRMMEQVGLVNEAFEYRTPFEVKVGDRFKDANFARFDVHNFVSLWATLLCPRLSGQGVGLIFNVVQRDVQRSFVLPERYCTAECHDLDKSMCRHQWNCLYREVKSGFLSLV